MKSLIFKRCKIQLLIRKKVHRLDDNPIFHRLKILRTLCNNDDVCPCLAALRFPKTPGRQKLVIYYQPVIVNKQDVDSRLYVPMLESIIKQNHIGVFSLFIAYNPFNAMTSVLVNGHMHFWKLRLHLEWLVTNILHFCTISGKYVSPTLPFIPTAQDSHFSAVL